MKSIVFTLIFGFIAYSSSKKLDSLINTEVKDSTQGNEVLYMPKVDVVEFSSFGYRNVLADIIWFKTINYFGKHFRSDQNYKWLFALCDTVTTLNPYATHAYEFGAMMLAWEQNAPDKALELLDKALETHKTDWRLFYYRGIFKLIFKKDSQGALDDFIISSKLPDVHPTIVTLAGKKLAELNGEGESINFLTQMYESSTDETMKSLIKERIEKLKYGK